MPPSDSEFPAIDEKMLAEASDRAVAEEIDRLRATLLDALGKHQVASSSVVMEAELLARQARSARSGVRTKTQPGIGDEGITNRYRALR